MRAGAFSAKPRPVGSGPSSPRLRRALHACAAVALVALSSGCSAARESPTLTLVQFGAVGDDRADDTAALQKALAASNGRCLDGEGRNYRVRGTLRAAGDLCLVNTRLRQDVERFDTRPLIRGTCPAVRSADAIASCADPELSRGAPDALKAYLSTRTLLIRPEADAPHISVVLRNVRIDRGDDPSSGARSEAAGIWIGYARSIVLEDVEITGAGKGFGLMIVDAENVSANRLNIHDLVWAPYVGDAELTIPGVKAQGWNTAPIREFRFAGQQGVAADGFFGVRVQEQLSCVMIVRSADVTLRESRIDGCRARFAEGDLPWQADGIGIGESTRRVSIAGVAISDTWEGIDVVGGGSGVSDVTIDRARIDNSFGYGVKGGYALSKVTLSNSRLSNSGLAGVVLYGPVAGATVSRTTVDGVGTVRLGKDMVQPWQQERAGVLVEEGSSAQTATSFPTEVTLDRVIVKGGAACRYGLLNATPARLRQNDVRATGCEIQRQNQTKMPD